MVPEDHPLVGHQEIAAVFQSFGRSCAEGIQGENLRRNELAIEAVPQRITTGSGDHQPKRVDRFSTMHGYYGDRNGAEQADASPGQDRVSLVHIRRALCRIRASSAMSMWARPGERPLYGFCRMGVGFRP